MTPKGHFEINWPLKDKTVLVDAICGQLLEAMIEDTVGKMKIQQRSQSQSVSGGIAGLPVDSGPLPVPGIIPPTSPTISNETPSLVPSTSPKSRAKVDMMQTAFDISSESSEEGMCKVYGAAFQRGLLTGYQSCLVTELSINDGTWENNWNSWKGRNISLLLIL